MKKAIVLVICVLFAVSGVSGFFAVGGLHRHVADACSKCPEPGRPLLTPPANTGTGGSAIMPGVTLRYQDTIEEGVRGREIGFDHTPGAMNYIKYYGDYGAYYNTTGYLTFEITSDRAEERITEVSVVIVRLGADGDENWSGDEDLPISWAEILDDDGNSVFVWDYRATTGARAVGVYRITVFVTVNDNDALLSHEAEPSCVRNHVHCESDCEEEHVHCEVGCEIDVDIVCSRCLLLEQHMDCGGDCKFCNPDPLEFTFHSICRSYDFANYGWDQTPNFGATFTRGSREFFETASLAFRTKFNVVGRPDERFYWDPGAAIYATDCDWLKVGSEGKYLTLNADSTGKHTFIFTVTFEFVHVDATGQIRVEPARTEKVELTMTFYPKQKVYTVWDVLLGIAVLAGLAGAAWYVTKLTRDVGSVQGGI